MDSRSSAPTNFLRLARGADPAPVTITNSFDSTVRLATKPVRRGRLRPSGARRILLTQVIDIPIDERDGETGTSCSLSGSVVSGGKLNLPL